MIKSKSVLYSFLRITKEDLCNVLKNVDNHYELSIRPKMKYGEKQRDKNHRVRYRLLWVPNWQLKVLQRRINSLLQNIPLLACMYGSITNKNNIQNALQHVQSEYFFTVDLTNFFDKVNYKTVYEMFVSNDFSPDVAHILTRLTTRKGSVPQGAPTSPVIANLVLVPAVKKLAEFARSNDVIFTNFLDDFTFSSDCDFRNLSLAFLPLIQRNGLIVNQRKVCYSIGGCEITGIIVYKNRLKVIQEMRIKAKGKPALYNYTQQVFKSNLIP